MATSRQRQRPPSQSLASDGGRIGNAARDLIGTAASGPCRCPGTAGGRNKSSRRHPSPPRTAADVLIRSKLGSWGISPWQPGWCRGPTWGCCWMERRAGSDAADSGGRAVGREIVAEGAFLNAGLLPSLLKGREGVFQGGDFCLHLEVWLLKEGRAGGEGAGAIWKPSTGICYPNQLISAPLQSSVPY